MVGLATTARRACGVLSVLIAGACAGDHAAPLGPLDGPASPSLKVATPTVAATATALVRSTPLRNSITVSRTVGPLGGVLEIPEAGLRVVVPAGAVTQSIALTATARAGSLVAYDFGPHGTRFAQPLAFSQDLGVTRWSALPRGSVLEGGYYADPSQIDPNTGRVLVDEFLAASVDRRSGARLSLSIWHFSGYMVSTGRH